MNYFYYNPVIPDYTLNILPSESQVVKARTYIPRFNTLFKQVHAPTAIHHAVYCNLYSMEEKNLVLAGSNYLQIFRLYNDDATNKDSKLGQTKLEFISSMDLYEPIQQLASVKFPGGDKCDGLVLSFSEAKMSVLQYDSGSHELKTTSLHYYEDNKFRSGRRQFINSPMLRVDPDNRCAAMLLYDRFLAILPFRRDYGNVLEVDPLDKPPVLPSFTIELESLTEKVSNVIDMQFLEGYYEPTLFILYEPLGTWSGRVTARQDTCMMVAISINLQECVNPVIWSQANLPYDSLAVLPVPKPIGGVLVLALNSLLYFTQGQPPYSMRLNSNATSSTNFNFVPMNGPRLTLEGAHGVFISSDQFVLSLGNGDLFVFTLIVDPVMRIFKTFQYERTASSVVPSCMCMCGPGHLFVGSHLANPLLLGFFERSLITNCQDASTTKDDNEHDKFQTTDGPTGPKQARNDDLEQVEQSLNNESQVENIVVDVDAEDDDDDDLEAIYREAENISTDDADGKKQYEPSGRILRYKFFICDSLTNVGPMGQITVAETPQLADEFEASGARARLANLELVTTSGWGRSGAVSLLRRTIRPILHSTFELPGCTDTWGLLGEEVQAGMPTQHAYLVLSREDSTMVLEAEDEIVELEASGFCTSEATVACGNLGDGRYILQVSPTSIRLLEGTVQRQHINLDTDWRVRHVSIADPYALLITEDDVFFLVELVAGPRLQVQQPLREQFSSSTCCALFHDSASFFEMTPDVPSTARRASESTLLPTTAPSHSNPELLTTDAAAAATTTTGVAEAMEEEILYPAVLPEDRSVFKRPSRSATSAAIALGIGFDALADEDVLIYGDTDISHVVKVEPVTKGYPEMPKFKTPAPSHYAFIAYENGALEIYSLPNFSLCFLVKGFFSGPRVLVDSVQMSESSAQLRFASYHDNEEEAPPTVEELLVQRLGRGTGRRPALLVRTADELIIYEAFRYFLPGSKTGGVPGRLQVRWRRLPRGGSLLRVPGVVGSKARRARQQARAARHAPVPLLRPFEDVGGYRGVFVAGPRPIWIIFTEQGQIQTHPMHIDGSVTAFTPFNRPFCEKGFLYFNSEGEMRICSLDPHYDYSGEWAVRKKALRATPNFVRYHKDSGTFVVVTSTNEFTNQVCKLGQDGDKEFEVCEKDEAYVFPTFDKFTLQLYDSETWEEVPASRINFQDWEIVTACDIVRLKSEATLEGLKDYVVVGSNLAYGEEITSRGSLLLFTIIDVVPEPGQPLTRHKVKVLYEAEQKGPVTALASVLGFLVVAIGQKVYIWQLKDEDLVGVAFVDSELYIQELHCVKNLILATDVCKSAQLLRFQSNLRVLSTVSRDSKPRQVLASAFLIDGQNVGFLLSDAERNLHIMAYDPADERTSGGKRLSRKADMRTPSRINSMFRVRNQLRSINCVAQHSQLGAAQAERAREVETLHTVVLGSLDGAVYQLTPVRNELYARLRMMEKHVVQSAVHPAGLNPRAARQATCPVTRTPEMPQGGICDGDLMARYAALGHSERVEVAKKAGQSADLVMDDMVEIELSSLHF